MPPKGSSGRLTFRGHRRTVSSLKRGRRLGGRASPREEGTRRKLAETATSITRRHRGDYGRPVAGLVHREFPGYSAGRLVLWLRTCGSGDHRDTRDGRCRNRRTRATSGSRFRTSTRTSCAARLKVTTGRAIATYHSHHVRSRLCSRSSSSSRPRARPVGSSAGGR